MRIFAPAYEKQKYIQENSCMVQEYRVAALCVERSGGGGFAFYTGVLYAPDVYQDV
jgi:hypothetical protein